MKKALSSVLAILLSLGMLCAFAACKEEKPELSTEPDTQVEDTEVITTAATPGESETTDATEPPTEDVDAPVSEEETEETQKTPDQMSKEELVQYYNDAINNVREKKPSFDRTSTQKMLSVKTDFIGGIADGIVNKIVKDKMPGNPEELPVAKGKDNTGAFFSEMKVSAVKASDVTSIKATKEGNNYVITLTLGTATNPKKDGSNAYSRVFSIATRQDVLDELKGVVSADPNEATMLFHSGKATITVNPEGQVVKGYGEFLVDVTAKNVKASGLTVKTLNAYQKTSNDYRNFKY